MGESTRIVMGQARASRDFRDSRDSEDSEDSGDSGDSRDSDYDGISLFPPSPAWQPMHRGPWSAPSTSNASSPSRNIRCSNSSHISTHRTPLPIARCLPTESFSASKSSHNASCHFRTVHSAALPLQTRRDSESPDHVHLRSSGHMQPHLQTRSCSPRFSARAL
jgi:hypothetical protein